MNEEILEVAVEPVEPVEAIQVIPEIVEEKIYRYQPVDENSHPIGGAQVIKYRTPDELTEKLVEQNTLLIRKLRKETRKNQLGIVEEEMPADAERFSDPIEFKPRDLTDDERFDISRRLLDPTTAVSATEALFEAAMGAPLSVLGSTLQTIQRDNIALRAKTEADSFVSDNPEYYGCNDNLEAITAWMLKRNLAPVKANFQKAYDTLTALNVLTRAPQGTAEDIVPIQEIAEVAPVAVAQAPVAESVVARMPSGFTRENTSDAGTPVPPGSDIVYEVLIGGQKKVFTGLAAVNAMPSDEYKRRLYRDKEFASKIDKLEAAKRRK
jgi:hypothetical protein